MEQDKKRPRTPRSAKEWRALIGKDIRFFIGDSLLLSGGQVEKVEGKNVWIGGNPYWGPHLTLDEVREPEEKA